MTIGDTTPHWYEALPPSITDSNGSCTVGSKWVEINPGKSIHFTIIRQANGDLVVRGDQASLLANQLTYRECTIYAQQAHAMPAQVIWSIILEGVKST
ncbi:hypothetical protein BH09BAC4_BH09BAC4_05090 [soil metagenome]